MNMNEDKETRLSEINEDFQPGNKGEFSTKRDPHQTQNETVGIVRRTSFKLSNNFSQDVYRGHFNQPKTSGVIEFEDVITDLESVSDGIKVTLANKKCFYIPENDTLEYVESERKREHDRFMIKFKNAILNEIVKKVS